MRCLWGVESGEVYRCRAWKKVGGAGAVDVDLIGKLVGVPWQPTKT